MTDVSYLIIGALLSLPGLYALYLGLRKDLEEDNTKLQLDSYANEIKRLQVLVDEQQRKINDLQVLVASLRSKLSALGKALKRLAAQLRAQGIDPAINADKLVDILEKDD